MESPTSSVNPPTEPASAETAEAKIEFKEEDGLKVDKRSKQNFLMAVPLPEYNRAGLKCSGCNMLSAHTVVNICMYEYDSEKPNAHREKIFKRVVGCMNCGKLSTK